jgi:hypothetical protein
LKLINHPIYQAFTLTIAQIFDAFITPRKRLNFEKYIRHQPSEKCRAAKHFLSQIELDVSGKKYQACCSHALSSAEPP